MSSPSQHTSTSYDISNLWEHNDGNYEDDGYWTFMCPPSYDSSTPSSIISIHCSEKEQLDEVTQVEPEFNSIWDEELLVTSSRDIGDITYEDPIERDMTILSPYEANDEKWLNPFSAIIEGGTTPDFVDSCYMQMDHYDEKFEELEPCIFSDSSMISPSYSSYSREACCTEDYFADIQHMMSLGYHFQFSPSRSIKEVVHPALPYIGKTLMIHINKTEERRWT